jgi:hypothetical protein
MPSEEKPMKHTSNILAPVAPRPSATVTIRPASSADAPALRQLAQLDSAPPPKLGPTLVAEVGGDLYAALPLDGGQPIADPFQRTAELVAMLATRARQLETRSPAAAHQGQTRRQHLRPASLRT